MNHPDVLEAEAIHVIRDGGPQARGILLGAEKGATGAFILIDRATNDTVGAGMIADVA